MIGSQNINHSKPIFIGLHQVGNVEHRFPKKTVTSLRFNL